MKKRNMSLILVLALILCLIPATAFADNETLSGNVTGLKEITTNTTTSGDVNVMSGGSIVVKDGATLTLNHTIYVSTGGSIVVNDGATLTINKTLDLASKADGTARVLKIEKGGKLVVKGNLFSKNNFADVAQLGTMEVSGTNTYVIMYAFQTGAQTAYIGNNGLITLDENAVITSTPLVENSYEGGYKYVISSSSATETATAKTKNFPNSGKDELVVADGATLDATAGMTLNGTSTKQLTVENGGTLKLPSDTTTAQAILESAYGEGDQKITSGTYSLDPSKVGSTPTSYVAEGYKVTKNDADNTWTVKPAGLLSKIAVVVKEPVVGETPASTYTSTVKADGSATASEKAYWFKIAKADYDTTKDIDEQKWGEPIEEEKFQKDYYYMFATYFVTEDGYEAKDLAVTVNGKKADFVDSEVEEGTTYVEVYKVFGPLAEKSPVTGDNNELGLFAVAGLISALGVALMLRRKHSM